jgi:hypothetical protein
MRNGGGIQLNLDSKIKVKSEWFFYYEDGTVLGPLTNTVTAAGLSKIAQSISLLSSPYLVIGDDVAAGETITEVFRKPVSIASYAGNMARFRTQILPDEAIGVAHQKASIFIEAASGVGTGVMFNLLRFLWSKAAGMVMTIEVRITVTAV